VYEVRASPYPGTTDDNNHIPGKLYWSAFEKCVIYASSVIYAQTSSQAPTVPHDQHDRRQ
jgi:hypothetical protein